MKRRPSPPTTTTNDNDAVAGFVSAYTAESRSRHELQVGIQLNVLENDALRARLKLALEQREVVSGEVEVLREIRRVAERRAPRLRGLATTTRNAPRTASAVGRVMNFCREQLGNGLDARFARAVEMAQKVDRLCADIASKQLAKAEVEKLAKAKKPAQKEAPPLPRKPSQLAVTAAAAVAVIRKPSQSVKKPSQLAAAAALVKKPSQLVVRKPTALPKNRPEQQPALRNLLMNIARPKRLLCPTRELILPKRKALDSSTADTTTAKSSSDETDSAPSSVTPQPSSLLNMFKSIRGGSSRLPLSLRDRPQPAKVFRPPPKMSRIQKPPMHSTPNSGATSLANFSPPSITCNAANKKPKTALKPPRELGEIQNIPAEMNKQKAGPAESTTNSLMNVVEEEEEETGNYSLDLFGEDDGDDENAPDGFCFNFS